MKVILSVSDEGYSRNTSSALNYATDLAMTKLKKCAHLMLDNNHVTPWSKIPSDFSNLLSSYNSEYWYVIIL
jgi:hypothetical protein